MNPCGVHRLPATLAAAAWIAALICAPVSASAPPSPADSARYCALLDEEPWLREPPPAAGKGSAELNAGEPGTVRMIYFLPNGPSVPAVGGRLDEEGDVESAGFIRRADGGARVWSDDVPV